MFKVGVTWNYLFPQDNRNKEHKFSTGSRKYNLSTNELLDIQVVRGVTPCLPVNRQRRIEGS